MGLTEGAEADEGREGKEVSRMVEQSRTVQRTGR